MPDTLRTILHTYRFDVSKPDEAIEYAELQTRLKGSQPHLMNCLAAPFGKEWKPEDSAILELETSHVFSNQWNTDTRRVFDWYQPIYPNARLKAGYWLEQTAEMQECRRNTLTCGYCGHHKQAAQGYEFCPDCLGSEYLKPTELHLLRLKSAAQFMPTREPLTEAEAARLMPEYEEAQRTSKATTGAARGKALRERIIKTCRLTIEKAKTEMEGKLWLIDHGLSIENVIYYSHTGRWCFGWRDPLTDDYRSRFLDVASEFPFDYDIKEYPTV